MIWVRVVSTWPDQSACCCCIFFPFYYYYSIWRAEWEQKHTHTQTERERHIHTQSAKIMSIRSAPFGSRYLRFLPLDRCPLYLYLVHELRLVFVFKWWWMENSVCLWVCAFAFFMTRTWEFPLGNFDFGVFDSSLLLSLSFSLSLPLCACWALTFIAFFL